MRSASELWRRLPVILRAILTGLLVLLFGASAWSVLFNANLKLTGSIKWATGPIDLLVGGAFLWGYWRYLNGAGWPSNTAAVRRDNFRVRVLSARMWAWTFGAGVPAMLSLFALQAVWQRLVQVPAFPWPSNFSQYSFFTMICIILAGAAEAGVVEEAAFRGYMQAPIERRHGPRIAIAIAAVMFGCVHLLNGSHELLWIPCYTLVGVILGSLAYLTKSVLPCMVLHAATDVSRWCLVAWRIGPPRQLPLVWQSGLDTSFWLHLGTAVISALVAVWAYRKLIVAARADSQSLHGMTGQGNLRPATGT